MSGTTTHYERKRAKPTVAVCCKVSCRQLSLACALTRAVPVNGGGVGLVLRKFRKLCGPTHQPYLMSLPIYEYISNTDLYEEVKKITT